MADRNKETVLDSLAKAKTNLLEALAKSQSNIAISKTSVRY